MFDSNLLPSLNSDSPIKFGPRSERLPLTLLVAGLLCAWSLRAQAANPRIYQPYFLGQALVMAAGLLWVALAPHWNGLEKALGLRVHWILLGGLVATVAILSALQGTPSGTANLFAWLTLLVLLVCTLGFLQINASDERWMVAGALWLILGYACSHGRLLLGLLPLAALASFLPLRKERPLLAAWLTSLVAELAILIAVARHRLTGRMWGSYFTHDSLWQDFSGSRVRYVLNHAGWFGFPIEAMPRIPTSPTHFALGALTAHGGWLGLLLWFGTVATLLTMAFRIAHRHRGTLPGDLLACLSFMLAILTLTSTLHAVGIGGLGVTLPLMGVDPGLTLIVLFAVGLGANLAARSPGRDSAQAAIEPNP